MKMRAFIDQLPYAGKLATLTQLYLELSLPLENALRAAEADLCHICRPIRLSWPIPAAGTRNRRLSHAGVNWRELRGRGEKFSFIFPAEKSGLTVRKTRLNSSSISLRDMVQDFLAFFRFAEADVCVTNEAFKGAGGDS